MNPFEDPEDGSYAPLEFQQFGEALYVDVHMLLDILRKRATLALRTTALPLVDTRTTDFERGRFAEMKNLYEVVSEHLPD